MLYYIYVYIGRAMRGLSGYEQSDVGLYSILCFKTITSVCVCVRALQGHHSDIHRVLRLF
jgi:hypothetical protein